MNKYLTKTALTTIIVIFSFLSCHGQTEQKDLLWKVKTNGKIIGSAAIAGNVVYFGSSDGVIHALDIKNGKNIWNFRTGGEIASKPAIDENLLYILSGDGYFYALNRKIGKVAWKFKTGGEHRFIRKTSGGKAFDDIWDYYLSGAAVAYGRVYFGSSDSFIYCLNTQTGHLIWKYKTGNVVHATPVISDHRLFVGSFGGFFYALNSTDGHLLWKFNTIGNRYFPLGVVQKAATVYKGGVYFGSRDFNIYVIDVKDGHGYWNYREPGSWIIARPTIYKGHVFFGTSDSHKFYSMNAENGTIDWKLPLNMRVYGSAIGEGNRVYFGCFNGYLYGVDKTSGKIVWKFQTDGSRKRYYTIYNKNGTFRSDFSIYGSTLKETIKNEDKIESLGSIMDTPELHNHTLFFGSTDSTFYAVRIGE